MEHFFKIKERGSTVSKELLAGITTFLAMAYILIVNPDILSNAGMDWSKVFTATALSAAIATLIMGFAANLPVALAPGLGLNAFFTYTVVIGMGCSWQLALTAVLLEGILFIILSFIGVREAIIKSIPENLKKAVAVGIGLFITIIGLMNAGIATTGAGTPIGFVNFNLEHSSAIVAGLGLFITIILYVLHIPGAILIGIIITTIIGIPFGVTVIPDNFRVFSLPETPYFMQFDFKSIIFTSEGNFSTLVLGKFFVIFFTFLFTDMFDTIGTLMGVAEQANLKDKNGDIRNMKGALFADAAGTVVGAGLGTSTVTSFVESTSGVAVGGRTGLTSVVTAVLFLASLFFGKLFAVVPAAATAPALIFVGYLMMRSVSGIDFTDCTEGIPAFITIASMPFSYSIAKGIEFGIIAYVICKIVTKKYRSIPMVTWILVAIFVANIIFEAIK